MQLESDCVVDPSSSLSSQVTEGVTRDEHIKFFLNCHLESSAVNTARRFTSLTDMGLFYCTLHISHCISHITGVFLMEDSCIFKMPQSDNY